MYLRETRQKRADGSYLTHLQLAESSWDPDKRQSKIRVIYNCGRAEDPAVTERMRRLARSILRRCSPDEIVTDNPDWQVVDAWAYGDLYVLEHLWRRVGFDQVIASVLDGRKIDFALERALFAMVANRVLAPCSKLYCYEQWLREEVRIEGADALELHHLYRAMDFLEANRPAIEEAIYFRMADLLNLDVELIFYDTTSVHFETDEEDEGAGEDDLVQGSEARPRTDGRDDAPQIVIGLAVTRDGFPVRHWIFPGNRVDVTTVKQDLKGWRVFVGDAGMVSKANLEALAKSGGRYIVCMPITPGGEVEQEVMRRPGRFKKVADNLEVKEVVVGDGERGRRYVVCFNPDEAKRQKQHRAKVLDELGAELESLRHQPGEGHSKRVCALRASRRYGRYLRLSKTGKPRIDQAKVKATARLDGKFVVHSNDDTLSAEDMALGYKQLQRVEEAWRTLKSGLRLRPVYHFAPHRIHAHVALAVFALLLERIAEQACNDTWRNIRDDLKQIKLAQLSSPNGMVW